jgi:hypothetical protein
LIKFSLHLYLPKQAVPLGFCSGGFSSTAGYVPGNEAHSLVCPEEQAAL